MQLYGGIDLHSSNSYLGKGLSTLLYHRVVLNSRHGSYRSPCRGH